MAENFSGVVESLLKGMDAVLSTKTVVGDATAIGDVIILPLVDVTFGVGAGSGINAEAKKNTGAGGLGGKMTPSAVLVINKSTGATKLVNVKNQDTITKVLDMIPDLVPEIIDKFSHIGKKKDVDEEKVKGIAFPEGEDKQD